MVIIFLLIQSREEENEVMFIIFFQSLVFNTLVKTACRGKACFLSQTGTINREYLGLGLE